MFGKLLIQRPSVYLILCAAMPVKKKCENYKISRADCDAPCFDLRASPKQQALLDVFASADQNMAAHR